MKKWDFLPAMLWTAYLAFEAVVWSITDGVEQPREALVIRPVLLLVSIVTTLVYAT